MNFDELYEKETIINFNELANEATIYTCTKNIMDRIDYLCNKYPNTFKLINLDRDSKTYSVPKNFVIFSEFK